MTSVKVCSRDDCPPTSVKTDLTTNCSNCAALLHLPCIGITLNVQQMVSYGLLDSPNVKILCNKCSKNETSDNAAVELNESFSAKTTTPTGKRRFTYESIVNELNALKKAIESNGQKLDKIDQKTTDIDTKTDTYVAKAKAPSFSTIIQNAVSTPKSSKKNAKTNTTKTPCATFAGVVSSKEPSAKRKRAENTSNEIVEPKMMAPKTIAPKFNAPKAKVGTKVMASGIKCLAAAPKRDEKPKFTKSVWVGHLDKYTDENDVADSIIENTPLSCLRQFRVRALKKKDQDVSKMSFASFKIDVAEEHFDYLMDPNVWPVDCEFREFINRNTTFGDYFPAINNNKSEQKNESETTEPMETMDLTESPSKTATKPTEQTSNQMPSAATSQASSPNK